MIIAFKKIFSGKIIILIIGLSTIYFMFGLARKEPARSLAQYDVAVEQTVSAGSTADAATLTQLKESGEGSHAEIEKLEKQQAVSKRLLAAYTAGNRKELPQLKLELNKLTHRFGPFFVNKWEYLVEHDLPEYMIGELRTLPAIQIMVELVNLYAQQFFVILIVLTMVTAYFMTGEKRKKTIDGRNLLPTSRVFQVLHQIMSVHLVVFGSFLACLGVVFIFFWVKNGLGIWQYPTATVTTNTIIPAYAVIAYFLLLVFFLTLLLTIISCLVQLLSKSLILNLVVLLAVLLMGQLPLLRNPQFALWAKLMPSTYLNFASVVLDNPNTDSFFAAKNSTEAIHTLFYLPKEQAVLLLAAYCLVGIAVVAVVVKRRRKI